MSSSSSSRSLSVPLSFDRFRIRSKQFRSALHHHHHNANRVEPTRERSKVRKSQVRPRANNSPEPTRIIYDTSYLFCASKDSNATASSPSLWKNSQNKTCPSSYFNSRPTSNVAGTLDCKNLSLINPSYTKQPEVPECECPPTPCMIRYRQSSVPAVITTRIIKRPQSFDHSLTKVDMEIRSSNLI
ncbi:unnamed protein product [Rotaria magnacalcarata]|uniref:Uncharacterized protein n=1 Tax=Rotaria magnacalcarata TaxID=392030 RepID=A0A816G2F1_9BILA|nr:unnamed protein product [Rotaria magnacalcarata]CAF1668374.1 unnamed protein product [Rotaria magnacalcarata]CAF4909139.1 unnamed protein product [Rotaria magnacalcarata]CAF4931028.1 unnamed protein product [Rotaria magnacalcarata]